MFERRHEPLLEPVAFARRLGGNAATAGLLACVSLIIGTLGYHVAGGLSWLDAWLNAAMIMTGMGPVDRMQTASGKVFSGVYAIFSGVAFLTTFAILVAPVVHRMMHRFHMQEDRDQR